MKIILAFFFILFSLVAEDKPQKTGLDILYSKEDQKLISFLNKTFLKDGKYTPTWSPYFNEQKNEYEKGFHEGMKFSIYEFPILGTDSTLKTFINENRKNKEKHAFLTGYMAAFEACSAAFAARSSKG